MGYRTGQQACAQGRQTDMLINRRPGTPTIHTQTRGGRLPILGALICVVALLVVVVVCLFAWIWAPIDT